MKILFDQIPEVVNHKCRGGEGDFITRPYTDGKAKIMMCRLTPGSTIGLHTHVTNCEVFYVTSGTGKVLCDGEYEILGPGDCHYLPQGHEHSLINDGEVDLCVLAVIAEHDVP